MSLKPKQIEAAALVAKALPNDEIARHVGIGRRTLDTWKAKDEFKAEVDAIRSTWREALLAESISDQPSRALRLNDGWQRMQSVIRQRSKDPDMIAIPGGDTGLMVRTVRTVGTGAAMRVVKEYRVDTGLLRELRAHEEQAAIELGQWKREDVVNKSIIIVMPRGEAPSTAHVLDVPPEEPPLAIPGVVIDLVPQR